MRESGALQRKSQSVIPGECWAFEGAQGRLLVALSGHVQMSHITYEHIPLSLAPDGTLDSAPKRMQVWVRRRTPLLICYLKASFYLLQAYMSEHDPNATLVAEFDYDVLSPDTMQTNAIDAVKYVRPFYTLSPSFYCFSLLLQPAALKAYPMVELRVLSNHGHPKYTCLYRFRVHGRRVYPQYGQEQHP